MERRQVPFTIALTIPHIALTLAGVHGKRESWGRRSAHVALAFTVSIVQATATQVIPRRQEVT
jgi:uncharacterized membrane protein